MRVVPKLGGNKQLLTGDVGFTDSLADLLLVAVDPCSINVAVSGVQGDLDGVLDNVALALPCSQAIWL